MQTLCCLDLTIGLSGETEPRQADTLAMTISEADGIGEADVLYAEELINGVKKNLAMVDDLLSSAAKGWTIGRMPTADRNILRLAVQEMYFSEPRLAPKIVVNEAVELAKNYGTDDSSRFIHGILRTVSKRLGLKQE